MHIPPEKAESLEGHVGPIGDPEGPPPFPRIVTIQRRRLDDFEKSVVLRMGGKERKGAFRVVGCCDDRVRARVETAQTARVGSKSRIRESMPTEMAGCKDFPPGIVLRPDCWSGGMRS